MCYSCVHNTSAHLVSQIGVAATQLSSAMQQAGHSTSIKVQQLALKLLAQLLVAHLYLHGAVAG
jgi:hypothetical protein